MPILGPSVSREKIEEAVLALEGTVISDLVLPLPGNLMDISKAAALVSGVVEDRIPDLLNRVRATTWDEDGDLHAYEFRKFPIGFPDILLVERADPTNVIFEMEAKSWYVLSSDPLTARFETSPDIISDDTLLVCVAWTLDSVVAGSPIFQRIYIGEAKRLAEVRDERWEAIEPTTHRVIQPDNAPGTPRNLINTQTRGEINRNGRWVKDADNYGKLDRLYDEELQTFKGSVFELVAAGKTLAEWRRFIKS